MTASVAAQMDPNIIAVLRVLSAGLLDVFNLSCFSTLMLALSCNVRSRLPPACSGDACLRHAMHQKHRMPALPPPVAPSVKWRTGAAGIQARVIG